MIKIKVLPHKRLPTRLPIWNTATAWLLLDRGQAPGWLWGAVGVLLAIVWFFSFVLIFRSEVQTDLKELQ